MVYLVSMNRFIYLSIHLSIYIYIPLYIIYHLSESICICAYLYNMYILHLNTFAHFLCQIRLPPDLVEPEGPRSPCWAIWPNFSKVSGRFSWIWLRLLRLCPSVKMDDHCRGWRHLKTCQDTFEAIHLDAWNSWCGHTATCRSGILAR